MKNILVTGASRGIGNATASVLLERGFHVYAAYGSNLSGLDNLRHVSAEYTPVQVDLSDYASIDACVEKLVDVRLDGVVNAAGIFEEVNFDAFDIAAFERNFRVNAFGPTYLVQRLQLNLNDGSAIVNVSSTDAYTGSYAGLSYAASKAAISNLTQSLALLLASRRIRVNAIAPGWIGDGMQAPEALLQLAADYNPLKRVGAYEDMAKLICYLLSEESAYVNGTTITADGGDMAKNYILEKESELL